MNNDIKKVQPFDSFAAVCKILVWAGYYKPIDEPTTQLKRLSHQIYRVLALLFVVVYNVQHLIFTVQHRNDMDKVVDCVVIEIPQLNLFAKALNMLIHTSRIYKLQKILSGPSFAVTDEQDEAILRSNKLEMDRLNKVLVAGVTISAGFWASSLIVNRYSDKNAVVNSYMPFDTNSWPMFVLSVFLEIGPLLWTAYGHMSLDQLIAAYYAHAQTQLRIINNQLKRLCSSEINSIAGRHVNPNIHYIDCIDKTVHRRFVQIVKRYETLIWYKNEVDDVFNFPLSVQFLSTAAVVCLVIFRMTALSVTSIPFMFLAMFFFILQLQIVMYCYYGNLVEHESDLVNESLYSTNWVLLSPVFRRSLLIAMTRWSRPIRPRVCGIIPLSLSTFLHIVKSSYTLYTVLVVAAKPESKLHF